MWFWIIYFTIGFLIVGLVSVPMQEDDGSMTTSGCMAALVVGAVWPLIILMAIGYSIGANFKDD